MHFVLLVLSNLLVELNHVLNSPLGYLDEKTGAWELQLLLSYLALEPGSESFLF